MLSTTYERYSNLSTYYYGNLIILKLFYNSYPKILSSSYMLKFEHPLLKNSSGTQI